MLQKHIYIFFLKINWMFNNCLYLSFILLFWFAESIFKFSLRQWMSIRKVVMILEGIFLNCRPCPYTDVSFMCLTYHSHTYKYLLKILIWGYSFESFVTEKQCESLTSTTASLQCKSMEKQCESLTSTTASLQCKSMVKKCESLTSTTASLQCKSMEKQCDDGMNALLVIRQIYTVRLLRKLKDEPEDK